MSSVLNVSENRTKPNKTKTKQNKRLKCKIGILDMVITARWIDKDALSPFAILKFKVCFKMSVASTSWQNLCL